MKFEIPQAFIDAALNNNVASTSEAQLVAAAGGFAIAGVVMITVSVFFFLLLQIIAYWQIYKKADYEGWKSIIPFYNLIIFLRIINRPWWWFFLFMIPGINIIMGIIAALDLGKVFGKGTLWSVFLLILLQPIGTMILGFSSDEYEGK